jgi:hypothetical protein
MKKAFAARPRANISDRSRHEVAAGAARTAIDRLAGEEIEPGPKEAADPKSPSRGPFSQPVPKQELIAITSVVPGRHRLEQANDGYGLTGRELSERAEC